MSQQNSAAYSFVKLSQKYDFREAEKMKSSKMFPGPGMYTDIDNKNLASKTATYSFPKQARMQTTKPAIVPGPGAYTHEKTLVDKKTNPKFSVGKAGRTMDIFSTEGGSQYFQGSVEKPRASSPGPGYYQLEAGIAKTKPRITSFAVEKSQRGVDFTNEHLKTPGPGAYDNDTGKVKTKNPTYSIPKLSREDPLEIKRQKQNLPGPGVYNVNTSIGTGQTVNQNINLF